MLTHNLSRHAVVALAGIAATGAVVLPAGAAYAEDSPVATSDDATTDDATTDDATTDDATTDDATTSDPGASADANSDDAASNDAASADASSNDANSALRSGPLLDACPLAGPSTFEDSWGWARSGGRSHEGVDMMAERGTPIMAVRDGSAQFKTNRLGGRAIWLTAANGDRFYYAHLDAWEGESREVEAGELIGYVGSTGNAGSSHLHFETLPGGDVVNPYPHTLGACVPSKEELAAAAAAAAAADEPQLGLVDAI